MMPPELETPRLRLRAFTLADVPAVTAAVGVREVSETTANIPHPYEPRMAEEWIERHAGELERRERVTFGATLRGGGELIGAVSLNLAIAHARAELGYWVALPHWGKGYATEAARAAAAWGFAVLGLHRVHAHHVVRNPASGRVMLKLGMLHEGTLRDHMLRNGRFEGIECYGLLAGELTDEPMR